jgi:hypothetical protein
MNYNNYPNIGIDNNKIKSCKIVNILVFSNVDFMSSESNIQMIKAFIHRFTFQMKEVLYDI